MGWFAQRLILCHRGYDRPVVFVTEGYSVDYTFSKDDFRKDYTEEIAENYDANLLLAEYRFFGESLPDTLDWNYLTTRQASADLHRVYECFRGTYTGKWIATGISKGGMAVVHYLMDYPEDMDAVVAYVAPFNLSVEDNRNQEFLQRVGTPEERAEVLRFQREALRRKDELIPLLRNYSEEYGLEYRVLLEEIFYYIVLEYSFSFWQWGLTLEHIPEPDADARWVFHHLTQVFSPVYFAKSYPVSGFVQAVKELGYYGYDVEAFKDLLPFTTTEGHLRRTIVTEEAREVPFDDSRHRDVRRFLRQSDPRLIFLYGEYDPWTATGISPDYVAGKENTKVFINSGGSHLTRIGRFPEESQEEIWELLDRWILEE